MYTLLNTHQVKYYNYNDQQIQSIINFNYCTVGKKRVESFLDLLIGISKQNPKEMTDLDIREEVDTFLFEGHDTSSTAMSLTLIHLGLHQDIQVNIIVEYFMNKCLLNKIINYFEQ